MLHLLLVVLATSYIGSCHAAGMQKWVDADGKTHYGERPPAQVTSTAVETEVSVAGSDVKPAKPRVILYSTSWCGYCKRARVYMNQRGIKFRDLDIEKNSSAKRDFERARGRGVPHLVRGDESLRGFTKASYDRFFAVTER